MDIHSISKLPSIASVTPTLCELLGISFPINCSEMPLNSVMDFKFQKLGADSAEKVLIYAPDAIGMNLFSKHPKEFEKLVSSFHKVELKSIFPPKTPVCFASMFSGALPDVHGIKTYEKPVLKIETLFDALIKSQKKVAIVAVKNSSIDTIFRDRQIDYYSETYDKEVLEKALKLIQEDIHDVILVYHQEYDDLLHLTTPYSPEAFTAMKKHIDSFFILTEAMNRFWKKYNRFVAFSPDHGGHIDLKTGRGDHCLNIPEDMHVQHFYGLYTKE